MFIDYASSFTSPHHTAPLLTCPALHPRPEEAKVSFKLAFTLTELYLMSQHINTINIEQFHLVDIWLNLSQSSVLATTARPASGSSTNCRGSGSRQGS